MKNIMRTAGPWLQVYTIFQFPWAFAHNQRRYWQQPKFVQQKQIRKKRLRVCFCLRMVIVPLTLVLTYKINVKIQSTFDEEDWGVLSLAQEILCSLNGSLMWVTFSILDGEKSTEESVFNKDLLWIRQNHNNSLRFLAIQNFREICKISGTVIEYELSFPTWQGYQVIMRKIRVHVWKAIRRRLKNP